MDVFYPQYQSAAFLVKSLLSRPKQRVKIGLTRTVGTARNFMAHVSTPITERIRRNVVINPVGCWVWQRHLNQQGYGLMGIGSRTDGTRGTGSVHRESYKAFVGPIPEGLQIDHVCRNRACANPEHLEPVTCQENLHRGNPLWKQQMARTHCPQGHEYSGDNLYMGSKNGRNCKTCMKARSKARYWAKKMELAHV